MLTIRFLELKFISISNYAVSKKKVVMIDLVRIQIPVSLDYVVETYCKDTGKLLGGEVDMSIFLQYGLSLAAGTVTTDEQGNRVTTNLYHPFESLPSSHGSLAFKIFAGGQNYLPYIELKASPAKLLQGHNVYGTCDVEKCVSALLDVFCMQFPDITNVMDWHHAEVCQMDFTYSAHVDNIFTAKQVIEALRHVSAGQIRTSRETYETSVLWNAGSEHCVREVYLKHFEVKRQIEDLTRKQKRSPKSYQAFQLQQLQSETVQQFAMNAVRFEAKVKKRMFKRLGIPTRITDLIKHTDSFDGDFCQYMWNESFKEIFGTFEGADVNVYNDEEVLKSLKAEYMTITKDGKPNFTKANRVFRFFRSIKNEGFQQVKETTPHKTFYRNLKELTEVVPRAYLQNLHSIKTNVVPLVRLINVDFSKQHPAGWEEPLHMSQQLDSSLKQPLRLVG